MRSARPGRAGRRFKRTGPRGRGLSPSCDAESWTIGESRAPPPCSPATENFEVGIPGDDPLRDDFTDEMQQALDQLPQDLRETLLLVVVAELTHQEAADMLQVPLGTVLSRVSRARKRLRECLLATIGVNNK